MSSGEFDVPWLRGPLAEAYLRFARGLAAAAGAAPAAQAEAFRRFGAAEFAAGSPFAPGSPFAAVTAFATGTPFAGAAGSGAPPPGAPPLGATREQQRRWQAWLQAAQEYASAAQALGAVLAEIGATAGERFRARLAEPDATTAPLRVLFDDWIECAESAYQESAHGERFCAAQARVLNALAAWRIAQRPFTDDAARALDVPTRAEVDELQRAVHALRAELADAREPRRAQAPRAARAAAPKRTPAAARPRRARKKPQ